MKLNVTTCKFALSEILGWLCLGCSDCWVDSEWWLIAIELVSSLIHWLMNYGQ
jgi:hypothetical protein